MPVQRRLNTHGATLETRAALAGRGARPEPAPAHIRKDHARTVAAGAVLAGAGAIYL